MTEQMMSLKAIERNLRNIEFMFSEDYKEKSSSNLMNIFLHFFSLK